jgi:hypothetical protein
MKYSVLVATAVLLANQGIGQKIDKIIKEKEVTRIEKTLSSDAMEGRATFSPGIEKAADFISEEMAKTGLQTFNGASTYRQTFTMFEGTTKNASASIGGVTAEASQISCFSQSTNISFDEKSGYKVVRIKAGEKFMNIARPLINTKENTVVLVDTSLQSAFKNLRYFKGAQFPRLNKPFRRKNCRMWWV